MIAAVISYTVAVASIRLLVRMLIRIVGQSSRNLALILVAILFRAIRISEIIWGISSAIMHVRFFSLARYNCVRPGWKEKETIHVLRGSAKKKGYGGVIRFLLTPAFCLRGIQ